MTPRLEHWIYSAELSNSVFSVRLNQANLGTVILALTHGMIAPKQLTEGYRIH